MKRVSATAKLVSAMAMVAVLPAASALAADWEIDPRHSSASFTVTHYMVTKVRGVFGKVTGTVHQDERDISKSTVDVTIPASEVDTREPKRDKHLKSEAFFDAERFPEIRFTATRVAPAGKNKLRVTGNLTVHGVTRPVELAVELGDKVWKDTFPEHGPTGRLHWGITATTKLNRKDFGLNWNVKPDELKFVEAGSVIVGDEVAVELDIELFRPAPAGA